MGWDVIKSICCSKSYDLEHLLGETCLNNIVVVYKSLYELWDLQSVSILIVAFGVLLTGKSSSIMAFGCRLRKFQGGMGTAAICVIDYWAMIILNLQNQYCMLTAFVVRWAYFLAGPLTHPLVEYFWHGTVFSL